MFSQTAEYALRAVVWLADQPDAPQTTRQIARGTKVPADYLSKVLQSLARAGVVEATRGKGGGVRLARSPGELTVLEVVNAVDPIRRIHACPLKLKAHGKHMCALHSRLDAAIATVEKALAGATIADIIEEKSPVRPLRP